MSEASIEKAKAFVAKARQQGKTDSWILIRLFDNFRPETDTLEKANAFVKDVAPDME